MLLNLRPLPRSFLILWGLGAAMNSLSLLLLTAEIGDASAWGYASGWQRDVGMGDLVWAILVFTAARKAEHASQRFLCGSLTLFSAALAAHHASAYVQAGHLSYHRFWLAMNGFAVVWGAFCLRNSRSIRTERSSP